MGEHFGEQWQSFTANTQQGDYFAAGRIGAKLAIDASCLVGGGVSLTKTAATVSSKAAKAGFTRASRVSMQTIDLAADGMVNAVKTAAPASESMLTFQYKLQQQQQRTANLAMQGTKVDVVLPNTAGRRCARNNFVSSSKPRVGTSRLPNTSNSLPSSSSNSSSVQLSIKTQKLLGKTDKYKREFFERPGKNKDQTSLNAAKIELQGKQIDLAVEREISFDHVSKVKAAQDGLLRHLSKINARLTHPELSMIEREALNAELSNASKLLDHTERFVPRTTNTPQPPQVPKPKAP